MNLLHFIRSLRFRSPIFRYVPPEVLEENEWLTLRAKLLSTVEATTHFDGTPAIEKVNNLAVLLDNIRENNLSYLGAIDNLLYELTANVFNRLLTNEMVGVQAMNGPVGQILTLRVCYGSEARTVQAVNRLSIQILKETVEARTKKLSAHLSSCDITFSDTLVRDEVINAIGQEIAAEIDQYVLKILRESHEPSVTFDASYDYPGLPAIINSQCNLIAQRTRRAAGNVVVLSPVALNILSSSCDFVPATPDQRAPFVGTLFGSTKCYLDKYADYNTPVLVTYRGNATDAGYYYSPYQLVDSAGIVYDPKTHVPMVSFLTKFGSFMPGSHGERLIDGSNYFACIGIA